MIRKFDRKKNGHGTEELIKETRRLKRQLEAMTIRLDTFYHQLQKEVDRLQVIEDNRTEGD
jgi:hypothetical protein